MTVKPMSDRVPALNDEGCDAFDRLACPVDKLPFVRSGEWLECDRGHRYPMVQGVPVLLREDVAQTIGLAARSREMAVLWAEGERSDPFFVDTLGISEMEKAQVRDGLATGGGTVDAVISNLVGATNGILYKGLIGNLDRVPIPQMRLPTAPAAEARRLLDIGCSWGRWSLAAAASNYKPIGIDPSLGAVLAARRLARMRGLPFEGIVGDARYLPLRSDTFDTVFSYSVLQHFSKDSARTAIKEAARVLRPDGGFRIQMASATGVRSLQHMAKRGFREPSGFEVRYWLPLTLLREFRNTFGDAHLEVDCFFGLGLQASDYDLYGAAGRALLSISEALRKTSRVVPPLKHAADSLYIVGRNNWKLATGVPQ